MMDMVNQRSRGFGFVTFEHGSGGAQKAVEAQPINMFGKMVEVKLATPKGYRGGIPPPSPNDWYSARIATEIMKRRRRQWQQ